MRPEIAVLDIQGQYRVYTEFYRADADAPTIILINGSLATTASFAQTVRSLQPYMNVVLYDQPYAGRSQPHNTFDRLISKEDESHILLELIYHFHAEHLMSFSWGGACALLALAHRPASIERAVISSFSPRVNGAMRDYLERGTQHLQSCARSELGMLINETIGKHLPSLFKRFNHKYVCGLAEHEYLQMDRHVTEVLAHNLGDALYRAREIKAPVMFLNGELDEYTTVEDARLFADHVPRCTFRAITGAGHFLDMEHKHACEATRTALLDFLCARPQRQSSYAQPEGRVLAL